MRFLIDRSAAEYCTYICSFIRNGRFKIKIRPKPYLYARLSSKPDRQDNISRCDVIPAVSWKDGSYCLQQQHVGQRWQTWSTHTTACVHDRLHTDSGMNTGTNNNNLCWTLVESPSLRSSFPPSSNHPHTHTHTHTPTLILHHPHLLPCHLSPHPPHPPTPPPLPTHSHSPISDSHTSPPPNLNRPVGRR